MVSLTMFSTELADVAHLRCAARNCGGSAAAAAAAAAASNRAAAASAAAAGDVTSTFRVMNPGTST